MQSSSVNEVVSVANDGLSDRNAQHFGRRLQ